MAHGAALQSEQGWLWCDGSQGLVLLQLYERCLRFLRKSFTGLLEARRLVAKTRQASYEALASKNRTTHRGKGVRFAINQIAHPTNSLGVWCVEDTM